MNSKWGNKLLLEDGSNKHHKQGRYNEMVDCRMMLEGNLLLRALEPHIMLDAAALASGLNTADASNGDSVLKMGDSQLNSDTLEIYRESLAAIGNAPTADGDILLYGCDVIQSHFGLDFISAAGRDHRCWCGVVQADCSKQRGVCDVYRGKCTSPTGRYAAPSTLDANDSSPLQSYYGAKYITVLYLMMRFHSEPLLKSNLH
ncbi:MAG: DUF4347 domain-containing protein [Sedimenticola sp.]